MFTGIIKSKGKIISINQKELVIETNGLFENKEIGNSISVDGVCLTIAKIDKNKAHFDLMEETLNSTTFRDLKENDEVNLEPALTLEQGLDGHLVQGHVDCTGEIAEVKEKESQTTLKIKYPNPFQKFLSLKGSITVNGVSLTVSLLEEDYFEVCLVKHTLEKTTLGTAKTGNKVNLEFDAIAKHIKSLLDSREKEVKYEFLVDRGFI